MRTWEDDIDLSMCVTSIERIDYLRLSKVEINSVEKKKLNFKGEKIISTF